MNVYKNCHIIFQQSFFYSVILMGFAHEIETKTLHKNEEQSLFITFDQ